MKARGWTAWSYAAGGVILLLLILLGGYALTADSRKVFPMNGYVLEIQNTQTGAEAVMRNFQEGTAASEKFPASWKYRDTEGRYYTVPQKSYLHFEDGSISSFDEGIITNMGEIGTGVAEFYRLEERMIMTKSGEGWVIDNNHSELEFSELIWQLDQDTLLAASDDMELVLPSGERENVSGYLEITYLDSGIVQLANQEQVKRTLSGNTKIKFSSGAVLDLSDGVAYDRDGRAGFSLAALLADAESITSLSSQSAGNWQPPVFSILNDDGTDGEKGETGEEGEDGEEGKEGEEGEEGKAGEDGAAGGRGSGIIAGDEKNLASEDMARILITDITGSGNAAAITVKVTDPAGTLLGDSGLITVRNAESGAVVWKRNTDFSATDAQTFRIDDGSLKEDTLYIITVESGYQINMESGLTNTGTMVFVTRSFFMSSTGVGLEGVDLTRDRMSVELSRTKESTVSRVKIRLKVDGTAEDQYFESEEFDPALKLSYTIEFYEETAESLGFANSAELADLPYTVTLFTRDDSGKWTESAYHLTGQFLKEEPVFGKVTAERKDGCFEFQVPLVSDRNGAFQSVNFVVRDERGLRVKTLESTGTKVRWEYDVGLSGPFTVTASVCWNDNVNTLEKELESVEFTIPADNRLIAEWEPGTVTGQNIPCVKGTLSVEVTDESELVRQQIATVLISSLDGSWSKTGYVNLNSDACTWEGKKADISLNLEDSRLNPGESYELILKGILREVISLPGGEEELQDSAEILYRGIVTAQGAAGGP